MEFRKARFAKRSDRYPRNDRTQGEQGSRSGGSRYGGSSGGGSRYGGSSGGGSRYSRDFSSKFEKDRTPIHSRDSFRKNEYQPKNIVYQKKTRDYNSNESDEFYSTLRTKLFKILGGKKCSSCGFDDERALGFGHVDDKESFDYGQRGGSASSWEKYVSEPELARKSLQILCLNCNQINQK